MLIILINKQTDNPICMRKRILLVSLNYFVSSIEIKMIGVWFFTVFELFTLTSNYTH